MIILNNKFNKSLIKIVAVNLAIFLAAINNAFAITIQGDAEATIVNPLTISQNQPLNFGIIVPDSSGDSTVDQSGNTTGDAQHLGGAQNATFDITGYENSSYTITLDNSTTLTSGSDSMTVTSLSIEGGTSRSLSSGSDSFDVNGVLEVGASQAAGNYTGTYNVTINYN